LESYSKSSLFHWVYNAFAESLIKTLKVEVVYLNEYETFDDAFRNIRHFIEKVYNKKRLHSALGYKSPDQFEMEAALILLLNYLSTTRGAVHSSDLHYLHDRRYLHGKHASSTPVQTLSVSLLAGDEGEPVSAAMRCKTILQPIRFRIMQTHAHGGTRHYS
jgi:hypothetical protein